MKKCLYFCDECGTWYDDPAMKLGDQCGDLSLQPEEGWPHNGCHGRITVGCERWQFGNIGDGIQIMKRCCRLTWGGYAYDIEWSELKREADIKIWYDHLSGKRWWSRERGILFTNVVTAFMRQHNEEPITRYEQKLLHRHRSRPAKLMERSRAIKGEFLPVTAADLLREEEPASVGRYLDKIMAWGSAAASSASQSSNIRSENMLELFRDKDRFGIVTDAADERTFIEQFAAAVGELANKENDPARRKAEMASWIRQSFEVLCKLRGYKSTVRTRTLIEAGEFTPGQAALEAKVDDHGSVLVPEDSRVAL